LRVGKRERVIIHTTTPVIHGPPVIRRSPHLQFYGNKLYCRIAQGKHTHTYVHTRTHTLTHDCPPHSWATRNTQVPPPKFIREHTLQHPAAQHGVETHTHTYTRLAPTFTGQLYAMPPPCNHTLIYFSYCSMAGGRHTHIDIHTHRYTHNVPLPSRTIPRTLWPTLTFKQEIIGKNEE